VSNVVICDMCGKNLCKYPACDFMEEASGGDEDSVAVYIDIGPAAGGSDVPSGGYGHCWHFCVSCIETMCSEGVDLGYPHEVAFQYWLSREIPRILNSLKKRLDERSS